MVKESSTQQPVVSLLSTAFIERIIEEAKDVLEKTGIWMQSQEGLELLGNAGARIDKGKKTACIPKRLVEESLKSVPSSIKFYDRNGNLHATLEGNNSYFVPGSSSIKVWDSDLGKSREPLAKDQINFVKVTDALANISVQAAGPYPTDVPVEITGQYRHFSCLRYGTKPIWGGLIAKEGVLLTKDLFVAVRGSEKALREKPLCMFPALTSPPLRWSDLAYYVLTQFAQQGIPVVLSAGGASGLSAPVTMAGTVVQTTAESLSGIVMSQLTSRGAPLIWSGSGSGGIPIAIADSEVGKYLGIPTQTYWSSNAKCPDSQAGLESGISTIVCALAGINLISSPGTLDRFAIASLEKLVLDNEICGMARHLVQGITPRGERLAEDLFTEGLYEGKHFVLSPTTVKWLRQELFMPGPVISRVDEHTWMEKGSTTAEQRAKEEVKRILATHEPEPLDKDIDSELIRIMTKEAKKYGMDKLPL